MDGKLIRTFLAKKILFVTMLILALVLVEIGSIVLINQTGGFMDTYVSKIGVHSPNLSKDLTLLMLLLIGVLVARFVNKALDFYLSNNGMIYVESKVLDHLMHVELEEIMLNNKIELAQQVNNDAVVIADYWVAQLPNLVIKVIKLVFILVISAYKSTFATILLIVVSLFYIITFLLTRGRYKKLNLDMLNAQQEYFGVLGGELLNVFLVKANSWYQRTIYRFERMGGIFVEKSLKFLNFDFFLSNVIGISTQALTIIIPVILHLKGEATLSNFFVILTLSQVFFSDLTSTVELVKSKNRKDVASIRLNNLLGLPLDVHGTAKIERIEMLELDDIWFSYQRSNKVVFDKVKLICKTNTITAIVGDNGSGKSTLMKIIIGLLYPQKGEVNINQISLKSINLEELRKSHIAFCEQEPYLLPDTILNNLNYGLDTPKSIDYYKTVPLLDFVSDLEMGFETLISSGSQNLSGGQKQKIALSRTMAKDNASLLIFDEPTSALDEESTIIFMNSLQQAKKQRIILIVTHNASIRDIVDKVFQVKV